MEVISEKGIPIIIQIAPSTASSIMSSTKIWNSILPPAETTKHLIPSLFTILSDPTISFSLNSNSFKTLNYTTLINFSWSSKESAKWELNHNKWADILELDTIEQVTKIDGVSQDNQMTIGLSNKYKPSDKTMLPNTFKEFSSHLNK